MGRGRLRACDKEDAVEGTRCELCERETTRRKLQFDLSLQTLLPGLLGGSAAVNRLANQRGSDATRSLDIVGKQHSMQEAPDKSLQVTSLAR